MRALPLAILVVAAVPALSYAQEPDKPNGEEQKTDAEEYVEQGHVELGGSISGSVEDDETSVAVGPSVGLFVRDRIEMTALILITFTRETDELDMTTTTNEVELVFEPSYHYPVGDKLLAFGAAGVGTGWDGDFWFFEVVPRLGLNVLTTASTAITPSVRLPIKFGKSEGDPVGDFGTSVAFTFNVAVTASW